MLRKKRSRTKTEWVSNCGKVPAAAPPPGEAVRKKAAPEDQPAKKPRRKAKTPEG